MIPTAAAAGQGNTGIQRQHLLGERRLQMRVPAAAGTCTEELAYMALEWLLLV
jgi:hypothetical protein